MADALTRSSRRAPAGRPAGGRSRGDLAAMVLDSTPFAVLAIDRDDQVLFANNAAQDLFLLSTALIERAGLATLLAPASPVFDLIGRARREVSPVSGREIALDGPTRGPVIVDVTATPADDGETVTLVIRVQGRARNITERWTQSSAARSVAGLGQTLAHEIKNPLAGIRGAAQLLMRTAPPDELPLGQLICDETDRIRRLVDRMEAIGEPGLAVRKPVNVHGVLDRVITLAKAELPQGVAIQRRFDPSLPEIGADSDQLIQAFLNLVKNAMEAVVQRGDDAGVVSVATTWRPGVRIRAATGGWATLPLEVSVTDNGPGVPDDLREHLFEPFVTTKTSGGGLGLSVVAKIVNDHGGAVAFESEPGRTVFRALFPVERRGGGR